MKRHDTTAFIQTIKERCRMCYTCVRECPAKAIRIREGQAEVMGERCLTCGNCVLVCSQGAKQVVSSKEQVRGMLDGAGRVAVCVAPSFPAEFTDCRVGEMVGLLRGLGFDLVTEVAFGADLVAREYRRLLKRTRDKRFIGTACPAVVGYVEKYHPGLVGSLSPVVSPMVAMARVLRRIHGKDLKVVFVGPCTAKKAESASEQIPGEIDAALTFTEAREMFRERGLAPGTVETGEFDGPHSTLGGLFPISRGMLQAAGIGEDLVQGEIVAADGRRDFVQAVKEFESGAMEVRLLEVLCCNGCIMGPGMSDRGPLFSRRSRVSRYVRERMESVDRGVWESEMRRFEDLDLSRVFRADDQRVGTDVEDQVGQIMARMGKLTPQDELNCGACGYDSCREHAVAIHKGLAESEMCLPFTIEQLRRAVKDLAVTNEQLASAQAALIQSEKMASMGQLAAGIAHEVNNPLGVVLMYAHLMMDDCQRDSQLHQDLGMIVEQADRCKKIVSGLLHFARQNKMVYQRVDVAQLVDGVMRVLPAPENVRVEIVHAPEKSEAELDRDQVVQVLTNLVTNAYAAMPEGGALTVSAGGDSRNVVLSVKDTGVGIPRENLGKVFEPFFTTKQIGKGTGLGLAVTYGIVKMHRGSIEVQSNADQTAGPRGSTFTVTLPRRQIEE